MEKLTTKLDEVKNEFNKWLLLDDDLIIEVPLAVVIANMFNQMPIWMMIIAPPSSAKTEILLPIGNLNIGYNISKVTPQTFISGWGISKDSKEGCLLHSLSNAGKKMIVMKDFTTILEMRADSRSEILAQLREIYDGRIDQQYGNGKKITWQGKLGLIAGVTNIIDSHARISSMLGERFINFRINFSNREEISIRGIKNVFLRDEQRNSLSNSMQNFFSELDINKEIVIEEKIIKNITKLADFTAILRCGIERDGYDKQIKRLPHPENPVRLSQQFLLILKALTIMRGKTSPEKEEIDAIRRIACDSIPELRKKILETIFKTYLFRVTKEIAKESSLPTNTVKEICDDLWMLKIISKDFDSNNESYNEIYPLENETFTPRGKGYKWKLTEEWRERISSLEIFPEIQDYVPS